MCDSRSYRSSSTSSARAAASESYLDFQVMASPLALTSCLSRSNLASDSSSSCTRTDSSSVSTWCKLASNKDRRCNGFFYYRIQYSRIFKIKCKFLSEGMCLLFRHLPIFGGRLPTVHWLDSLSKICFRIEFSNLGLLSSIRCFPEIWTLSEWVSF